MTKKIYPNWTVEEFINSGRRLKDITTGVWYCEASPLGTEDMWFCTAMFEQMCVMDPDLERLFKTYEGTARQKERIMKHIKETVLKKYLQLVVKKFNKISEQFIDYFDVLYKTGAWLDDKKHFEKCENKGIEPETVKKERFII